MIKKIVKENIIFVILIILFIIAVMNIKNFSIYKSILDVDYSSIVILNNIISKTLTSVFLIFTCIGDWYIPVMIIIMCLIFFENKYNAIFLSLTYATSGLIAFITKILVERPRPFYSLIDYPDKYSFPSGHTLTSLVFFIMLFYLLSKKINSKIIKVIYLIITIVMILFIAFSRLYLGVHYLSDVVGAIIIGTLFVLMCINIINKNFSENLK